MRQLGRGVKAQMTLGLPISPDANRCQLYDLWRSQHAWYLVQSEFGARVLDKTLSPRERKLRELFAGAHAGDWLTAPTSSFPARQWSSSDRQSLLRWRLALPLDLSQCCPLCGTSQDAFGDHNFFCFKSPSVYGRQNSLRDTHVNRGRLLVEHAAAAGVCKP